MNRTAPLTWLLIANSNTALIYDFSNRANLPLLNKQLVKTFEDPKAKLRSSELGSDEPGRYHSVGAPNSAYSPDTSPHDVELEHFSQSIARFLLTEKLANHYEQLIICAEPHFLGILNQHLAKQVKESVKMHINKDYIPLINNSFNEFVEKFKENLL